MHTREHPQQIRERIEWPTLKRMYGSMNKYNTPTGDGNHNPSEGAQDGDTYGERLGKYGLEAEFRGSRTGENG